MPAQAKTLHSVFSQHRDSLHILSLEDCASLYRTVRKIKPSRVVELGSGIGTGTAIIAAALKRNGNGSVVSLEQLPAMRETAVDLIPKELEPFFEIIVASPEVREHFGQNWSCYKWAYEGDPIDLVVIDGPAEWTDESGALINLPNGDLIDLLPHLSESAEIFVDSRLSSVAAYRKYLSADLDVERTVRGRTRIKKIHHG